MSAARIDKDIARKAMGEPHESMAHLGDSYRALLGYLPLNIALSLVGSGIGKDSLVKTLVQLCAALALINIVGWLVWRKTRQLKVR